MSYGKLYKNRYLDPFEAHWTKKKIFSFYTKANDNKLALLKEKNPNDGAHISFSNEYLSLIKEWLETKKGNSGAYQKLWKDADILSTEYYNEYYRLMQTAHGADKDYTDKINRLYNIYELYSCIAMAANEIMHFINYTS